MTMLALVACKRVGDGPAATGSGSAAPPVISEAGVEVANAGSAAGVAPSGSVDLLHAVPARVAVSSLVKNPAITPFHLVDGSLDTAWNSKTGELVGSWVAFRVPAAAHITELQMTAGFVSSGDEGDYFTLNPRIKHVAIWRNGAKLADRDLDITVRALQNIPIGNEGGDYKIEVTAIEPGSKKNWRETCISELRVMGSATGMRPNHSVPEMSIGSLDAKPLEDSALYLVPPKDFGSIKDFCATLAADPKRTAKIVSCGDAAQAALELPSPLPAAWSAHWFCAKTETPSPAKVNAGKMIKRSECFLAAEANNRFFVLEVPGLFDPVVTIRESYMNVGENSRRSVELVDAAGSPDKDLIFVTTSGPTEWLTICAPTPTGAPACGSKQIAEMEFHNNNSDYGFDEYYTYKWRRDYQLGDELDLGSDVPPVPIRILE